MDRAAVNRSSNFVHHTQPIHQNKMSKQIILILGLFLFSLAGYTQKDYSYYYTRKTPEGMEKKDRKAEEDRNEQMIEKLLADSSFHTTLDSTALMDLFYQLKITKPIESVVNSNYSSYTKENLNYYDNIRIKLFYLASNIISSQKSNKNLRYEALDLLQSAISKGIITNSSIEEIQEKNKILISENSRNKLYNAYVYHSEGNRLIDYTEKNRDLSYFAFIHKTKTFSIEELNQMHSDFLKNGEVIRATHLLFEIMAKSSYAQELATKLLKDLESADPLVIKFIQENFSTNWKQLENVLKVNENFTDQYAYFIFNYIDEEQAYQYAQTVTQTKAIKYLLIEYTDRKFGLLEAMKKLLSLEMGVETTYNVMMRKTSDASGEDCLAILKYLDQYQSAALDSIDISAVPGFSYSNDGTVVGGGEQLIALSNRADFFQAMSIYRKYDMGAEADYLEEKYWYNQNLTVAEIEKNVTNKSLKSDLAASILLYYGTYCTEDRANGSRNRELLINECIPTLNKAAKYDPSNPYIYKALGDAYSFYGNGTRANEYYNKANNMGADMRDRTSASGKGKSTQTGKRGGKYYINSNGNKTYIKQ